MCILFRRISEEVVLFNEGGNNFDLSGDDVLNIFDDGNLLASFDCVLFILNLVFFTLRSSLVVTVLGGVEFLSCLTTFLQNEHLWLSYLGCLCF